MATLVEFPDKFVLQVASQGGDLSKQLLEDAALGAYCRDAITRRDLQSILGFATSYQVDGFLKLRGVEHGSYDGQDLLDDVAAMKAAHAEGAESVA